MTDEERKMLEDTQQSVEAIRRALFEVPEGSPADERPLIEGLRIMWRAWQRGSWAIRVVVWTLPTVAGLAVAASQLRDYVHDLREGLR